MALLAGALLLACGFAWRAAGQSPDENAGGVTEDHVYAVARRMGYADTILITLRIDPGYHVNANPASEPYLIPTRVSFSGANPERVGYPPALRFKPQFSSEPIEVYEGDVVITATFPPGSLDRIRVLRVTVTAQACTDKICLPPSDIPASVN